MGYFKQGSWSLLLVCLVCLGSQKFDGWVLSKTKPWEILVVIDQREGVMNKGGRTILGQFSPRKLPKKKKKTQN